MIMNIWLIKNFIRMFIMHNSISLKKNEEPTFNLHLITINVK